MTNEELNDLVQSSAARLVEHADSVIILVTRQEGGDTAVYSATHGNVFASYGAVGDYLKRSDERLRTFVRRNEGSW